MEVEKWIVYWDLGSGKISEVEEGAVFVRYQVLIVVINQGNNESLTNDEA